MINTIIQDSLSEKIDRLFSLKVARLDKPSDLNYSNALDMYIRSKRIASIDKAEFSGIEVRFCRLDSAGNFVGCDDTIIPPELKLFSLSEDMIYVYSYAEKAALEYANNNIGFMCRELFSRIMQRPQLRDYLANLGNILGIRYWAYCERIDEDDIIQIKLQGGV